MVEMGKAEVVQSIEQRANLQRGEHAHGRHYVIRSNKDRKLLDRIAAEGSALTLHDFARVLPTLGTRDVEVAAQLLERILTNQMEYDFERKNEDYFLLKERLTGSVVRLQTNDRLLVETFWNYYHAVS